MPSDERPELLTARSKPARRDAARDLYFDARDDWDAILDNLPDLLTYLEDPDPVTRGHVTGAIGHVIAAGPEPHEVDNWEEYRRELFRRLGDSDQRVRQTALGVLGGSVRYGEYNDADKRLLAEGLTGCMRDDSEIVRSRAASHASPTVLGHHPAFSSEVLPAFVAALGPDEHRAVRLAAAQTLWGCVTDERVDCSAAIAPLVEQARSTAPQPRALAARVLCPLWVSDPDAVGINPVAILLSSLRSDATLPRKALVETIEWLLETAPESIETLDPLVDQFRYPDEQLREAVESALVTATALRPEIAPAVAETVATPDTDDDIQKRLWGPLERIAQEHPETASDLLAGLFENITRVDGDAWRALDVVESVGKVAPAVVESALPVAIEQLSTAGSRHREEIAETLATLLTTDPDRFQRVIDPLIDVYPTLSRSKRAVLSGLLACDPGRLDLGPAVEQLAADVLSKDESVRAQAATLLALSPDAGPAWTGALSEYVDGTTVPEVDGWPLGVVAAVDRDVVGRFLSELAGELLETDLSPHDSRDQLRTALAETLAGDADAVDGAIQTLADGVARTANTKHVVTVLTALSEDVPERLGPVVGPLAAMAPDQHWGTCRNMVAIVAAVALAAPEAVGEHLHHLRPLLEDSHEETRRYTSVAFAAAGSHATDPVWRTADTLSDAISDPGRLLESDEGYVYAEIAAADPAFVENRIQSMVTQRSGRGEPFYEMLEAVAAVYPPITEVTAAALAAQLERSAENRRFCVETLGLIAQHDPDAVTDHVETIAANVGPVRDRVAETVTEGLISVSTANPGAMCPALALLTAHLDTTERHQYLDNVTIAIRNVANDYPEEVLAALGVERVDELHGDDSPYRRFLGDEMADR